MLTMKSFDIEERVNQAVHNFESGYNCAQSVFLAYSDVFELDLELAKKMSVSFGGGVGRMREVCGTVNAMAMLAGFMPKWPARKDWSRLPPSCCYNGKTTLAPKPLPL